MIGLSLDAGPEAPKEKPLEGWASRPGLSARSGPANSGVDPRG